jgi:predicted ester cyclase
MSLEESKAIVRQWLDEVWNNCQLDRVAHYYAPNYTLNGEPRSIDRIKHDIAERHTLCPDLRLALEDIIAEGDTVAYRYTWRGTFQGTIPESPFGPIQATGKTFTFTSMTFLRLANGKIVEDWFNADFLGMYQQLGVIPTPEQTQHAAV